MENETEADRLLRKADLLLFKTDFHWLCAQFEITVAIAMFYCCSMLTILMIVLDSLR
ncbi:hypothetical protein [Roseateles sp.]|uniref:hypothetical protein n=1 Tax=Roseateles sp. TaxID=1971397 RepID=UPI002F3FAACA